MYEEVTHTCYKTKDGKIFTSEKDARKHCDILDDTHYFYVEYGLNSCDGAGFINKVYFEVYSTYPNKLLQLEYYLERLAKVDKFTWVQGVSLQRNYTIKELSFDEFLHIKQYSRIDISFDYDKRETLDAVITKVTR